ncbi:MAG: hypothetical protein P1S60_20755 [Anaerolineae bacterium]|nr:hypothetical protein [Anaerolineae bacterium]
MTKQQKLILVIFAIVDIIIIFTLVWSFTRTVSVRPSSTEKSAYVRCAEQYLQALKDKTNQPTFARENDSLIISLIVNASEVPETTQGPQYIWLLLDKLAVISMASAEVCQNPQNLMLKVILRGDGDSDPISAEYLVDLNMDLLQGWAQDEISDSDFASMIQYIHVSSN